MNGFTNNYPLQYFGFEWVNTGVADKTVMLDVRVQDLSACNIHETGTVIHQCASMAAEKMCLVTNLTVKLFQKIIFIHTFFQDMHLNFLTTFLNLHYSYPVTVFYWMVQSLLAYLLGKRLIAQSKLLLSQVEPL